MNEKIEVTMSAGFKRDIQDAAEKRDQSMSEFMREAARRELQDGYNGDTK